MKVLITAIAIASATCILPSPVLAAKVEKKDDKKGKEKKGNPKASFKSLDKNGDGFLDKQEFAGLGSSGDPANFTHLDLDKDGKLDEKEFAKK